MANMDYCMFQNTLGDLRDCLWSVGMGNPESLSLDERKAREQLISLCQKIAADYAKQG